MKTTSKFNVLIFMIITALLITACSASAEIGQEDTSNTSGSEIEELDVGELDVPERPEPNPLTVTPLLEEDNTAKALVFPGDETSLSVTAADGTIFSLTFPPESLLSAVEVSMTPVTSLEGFPATDAPLHAVHLEPEGLTLMEPAILTIQTPSGIEGFTAFTTYSGGESFHISPSIDQEGAIAIPLMHFSTPGLSAAGDIFLQEIRESHPLAEDAGYWISKIAEDMGIDDRATKRSEIVWKFKFWSNDIKIKWLEVADYDHTVVDKAIAEYLVWYNWLFMMDDMLEDGDGLFILSELTEKNVEMRTLLAGGIWNALSTEIASRCRVDKDPDQALRMMRYFAIAEKLDLWGEDAGDSLQRGAVMTMIGNCVRFTLKLESEMNSVAGQFTTHEVESSSILILPAYSPLESYTSENLRLQFRIPSIVYYLNFTMPEVASRCDLKTEDGKMDAKLLLGLNLYDYPPRFDEHAILWVKFPEKPKEILECPLVTPVKFSLWADMFQLLRFTNPSGDEDLIFRLEKVSGQEYYAIYQLNETHTAEDVEVEEITTFKLIHEPE